MFAGLRSRKDEADVLERVGLADRDAEGSGQDLGEPLLKNVHLVAPQQLRRLTK
jgi:hypothetical protein